MIPYLFLLIEESDANLASIYAICLAVDVVFGYLALLEGCDERLLLLPNDLRSSSCKEVGAFFAGDFFLLTSRVIVFVCTDATR